MYNCISAPLFRNSDNDSIFKKTMFLLIALMKWFIYFKTVAQKLKIYDINSLCNKHDNIESAFNESARHFVVGITFTPTDQVSSYLHIVEQ